MLILKFFYQIYTGKNSICNITALKRTQLN